MEKIFYEKRGDDYIPVCEYNDDLIHSLPYGTHLICVSQNGQSTRYNVEPSLVPFVAASMMLEEEMCKIIAKAAEYKIDKPKEEKLTSEQIDAWDNLQKAFNGSLNSLYGLSHWDIGQNILTEIQIKAQKLLTNPAVKAAYDEFLLVSKLSK